MSRVSTWLPRGRALPPEVWAARHRGLLLVLAGHLMLLPAFAVLQGWSLGAAWLFDVVPAAFGAAACVPRLLAHAALITVRDGAAELLGGPRRRLARHDRGALPLLRDGRRARALRGVVGVPAGDRLRRAPARRDGRGARRHGLPPRATTRGAGPAIHGLFVAALAVANLVSWREQRDAARAGDAAPRSASSARSTTLPSRWRSSRREGRSAAGATASCASAPATRHPTACASGTSSRPTTASRCARAGRRESDAPEVEQPLRARRRQHRLDPLAPLADPRRRRRARTTSSPRASTSPPASQRRRAPRPPGPPRPAHRPAEPRAASTELLADALAPRRASTGSRCCSSTSTTSRSSTTRSATAPATSCWSRSPSASPPSCAPTTRSPASAATSS